MKVTVYTHPEFERKFKQYKKKYHSLVSDYRAFLDSIKENPFQGRSLGQGLRKVRFGVAAREEVRAEVCVSSHSQSIGLTKKT